MTSPIGKIKYSPEFRRLFKGNIVEVCEGEGTSENVCRLVYYVHDEQGNLLGRLDTLNLTHKEG